MFTRALGLALGARPRVDSHAMSRRPAALLGALLVCFTPEARAQAEDAAGQCVAKYEDALAQKKEGKLTAAHARFAECTEPACPGPVREECASQIKRLDALIPSVVPRARTRSGEELVDVRVSVGGRTLSEKLDGRAHRLDPGPWDFRFESAEFGSKNLRVVLAEGERLRKIEAVFDDPEASAEIPTLVYVLGGVGVAGLIGFTYFGLSGLSQESDLETCEPNCSKADTDDLKQTYLFADISLAIGIAGLGGATYFYLQSRSEPTRDGAPTLDGKLFGVGGVF